MKLASSLIKSTYKTTYKAAKSTSNYIKSYIVDTDTTEKPKISWMSMMIIFKNPKGGLVLDKAYIFIGDIPEHFHAYYINFMNWSVIGDSLIYNGEIYDKVKKVMTTMIEIDPLKVHLHCRVGDTIFDPDYFTENPSYYFHYFSNPKNKIYTAIHQQLTQDKVEVFDFTQTCPPLSKMSVQDRAARIYDPRFFTFHHQIYGKRMDHVMFSGLMHDML